MKTMHKAILYGAVALLLAILVVREVTRSDSGGHSSGEKRSLPSPESGRERFSTEDRAEKEDPGSDPRATAVRPRATGVRFHPASPPPPGIERRKDWLLSLPESKFRALVGTKRMNQYVSEIVDHLMAHPTSPGAGSLDVDRFLSTLNGRIQADGR